MTTDELYDWLETCPGDCDTVDIEDGVVRILFFVEDLPEEEDES